MNPEPADYRRIGRIAFKVIAAAIILFFAIQRSDVLLGALGTILSALKPLTGGIVLAYLLRPIQVRFEVLFLRLSDRLRRKAKTRFGRWLGRALRHAGKALSVLLSMGLALGLAALFLVVVLPQLITSVSTLVQTLPGQVRRLMGEVEKYVQDNAFLKQYYDAALGTVDKTVTSLVKADPLGSVLTIISNVISAATGLVQALIALIVAVYLLIGWERHVAQIKKLFLAVSHNDDFNRSAFDVMNNMNRIFSGFIIGKLIDSLIIGVLCFVVMTIMKMPYTLLISVIVGVTNVIPMFGPFLGAIPSAFLILLVAPEKCIPFLIFILILQQLDGNVIGPRILGDSTGISALYVTIAMLLFSKLMGFIGMVIGVPVFATLYYLVKRLAEKRLAARRLPTATEAYMNTRGVPTPAPAPASEAPAAPEA